MAIISETAVTLRFMGDDLDPSEVSRLLGAEADGHRKGDRRFTSKDGHVALWKTSGWILKTERAMPGDLDGQISALLGRLTDDLDVWRDLSRRYRGDVFIGLFMIEGNEGIGLSATSLQNLAERGLGIDFDIYGPLRDDLNPYPASL
jgi:hypothetical protein